MNDNFLGVFAKKFEGAEIINDIYLDSVFSKYYNDLISSYTHDISLYEEFLTKEDSILEIASGSGRILAPLLDKGYHIKGLEPSKSMVYMMKKKYIPKVYIGRFEDIPNLKINEKFDKFIIAATTISLFKYEEISTLLKNILQISTQNPKILFDIINSQNNDFYKLNFAKVANQTIYFQNFREGNEFIFNIYSKEDNKLGYSKKYVHNFSKLSTIFKENGFSLKIVDKTLQNITLEGNYYS